MNMMVKKFIWAGVILVVLMACLQPRKKAEVYSGKLPVLEDHFTEVVPLKGVDGLPDTNVVVVGDGPEKQQQYLADSIKVPVYAQDWLTVYWDTTITFQAQVPWDYSERLARATDLRTLPNLEEQVLKKYEQYLCFLIKFAY